MKSQKAQTSTEILDPNRIAALNAVLGLEGTTPHPFAHQVLFWDARHGDALGRDGHPRTGGLIPDMGLPRRMWAGGELSFIKDLTLGEPVRKVTRLDAATKKQGRSGPLAFVTLYHEIFQNDALCVSERQDLVYREDYDAAAPRPEPPVAPVDAEIVETKAFTTIELFRYSALTHNGHRIHYDRDYAKQVEGYSGVVVHGPLLAQHLMLLAQRKLGRLKTFQFRATSPLMDFEQASFCAKDDPHKGLDMWVAGPDGRQCMRALAQ